MSKFIIYFNVIVLLNGIRLSYAATSEPCKPEVRDEAEKKCALVFDSICISGYDKSKVHKEDYVLIYTYTEEENVTLDCYSTETTEKMTTQWFKDGLKYGPEIFDICGLIKINVTLSSHTNGTLYNCTKMYEDNFFSYNVPMKFIYLPKAEETERPPTTERLITSKPKTDNSDSQIENFLKNNWITLLVVFLILIIVIAATYIAVMVKRRTTREDERRLNSDLSRYNSQSDVIDTTPPTQPNVTEDFYTDPLMENASSDVYSDPYNSMYTQPLPKSIRKPPKQVHYPNNNTPFTYSNGIEVSLKGSSASYTNTKSGQLYSNTNIYNYPSLYDEAC